MKITDSAQVSGPASKTHCLGSCCISFSSIHSSGHWIGTPHYEIVQRLLYFPPLILIFCTVSCYQFSHPSSCLKRDTHFEVYYQYQPLLSPKVIWIRVLVENFIFISIIMFLVLLCFVPVALPQSIFCRFCGKAPFATYHRVLLSVKCVLIPHTFTHSAADLIIAGLHCSKLGNFRLPFLVFVLIPGL